jgi:hypothetical protein
MEGQSTIDNPNAQAPIELKTPANKIQAFLINK